MNQHDSISRRRVLQAVAAIIPLPIGGHVAAAVARFGMSRATQQSSNGLLALGAREAVTRIAAGDITAGWTEGTPR